MLGENKTTIAMCIFALLFMLRIFQIKYRRSLEEIEHAHKQKYASMEESENSLYDAQRKAQRHRSRATTKIYNYLNNTGNWVEFLTLLAVIVYAGFTYRIMKVTEGQLSEMKSSSAQTDSSISALNRQATNFENQLIILRENLEITKIQLAPSMKLNFEYGLEMVGNIITYFDVHPVWENTGQTNAVLVDNWDEFKVFSRSEISIFDFFHHEFLPISAGSIMAHQEKIEQKTLQISYGDAAKSITEGQVMMIWGGIEWKDTLPGTQIHYRYWCAEIPAKQGLGRQIILTYPANKAECSRSGDRVEDGSKQLSPHSTPPASSNQ